MIRYDRPIADRTPTQADLHETNVSRLFAAAAAVAPADPERQTRLVVYALSCETGSERLLSVAANIS